MTRSLQGSNASSTHSNRSSTPLAPLCTAINKRHFKRDLSHLPQTSASGRMLPVVTGRNRPIAASRSQRVADSDDQFVDLRRGVVQQCRLLRNQLRWSPTAGNPYATSNAFLAQGNWNRPHASFDDLLAISRIRLNNVLGSYS